MDVSAVNASTSQAGASAKALTSNFDTFLTLLTTQLKNQDPLQPMDSAQFTQQLVQYSGVEQSIYANKNLETLIALQTQGTMSSAVSYMGRDVTATSDDAMLADGKANWTYTLPRDAANVSLTVTDSTGKAVYTGTGPKTAGTNTVIWDGKTSAGGTAPPGIYTLTVGATDAAGEMMTAPVSLTGRVLGVDTVDGQVLLNVGGVRLKLSEVTSVREAAAADESAS